MNRHHIEDLARYGRRMFDRGLASSTGGNVSCRAGDVILVSATGSCLADLDERSIVAVTVGGEPIDGGRPSKELPVHLRIYATLPEVGAVVHGHSAVAVAASTLLDVDDEDCLPAYSAGYLMRVGTLPLIPFYEAGSAALADHVARALARSGHAVLLRNHGFFAIGADTAQAFNVADELVEALKVYMISDGRATPLAADLRARILAGRLPRPSVSVEASPEPVS